MMEASRVTDDFLLSPQVIPSTLSTHKTAFAVARAKVKWDTYTSYSSTPLQILSDHPFVSEQTRVTRKMGQFGAKTEGENGRMSHSSVLRIHL